MTGRGGSQPASGTRPRTALTALRVVVALLLIIHGAARVGLGIVDDFGQFLAGQGIPGGFALAYALTALELVGGAALALGKGTRVLCTLFIIELACGIVMVHAQEGWFVVGAGRGGMEYSALLIAVLAAVLYGSGTPTPGGGPPSSP